MNVAFWFFAVVSALGALCAMTLRNVVHCVLAVILFFFGIAGLFVILHAEFIAALQVLIYVGAVGVLLVLAVLLTRHVTGKEGGRELAGKWWAGVVTAAVVLITLCAALWVNWDSIAAKQPVGEATTAELGAQMMRRFVLPFEVVSVLLTAAMIGAIVIALEEVFRKKNQNAVSQSQPAGKIR